MAKVTVKSPKEIEYMRECCRIVAELLRMLRGYIRAGVTTKYLDQIAEEFITAQGATPAFKGYGFEQKNRFPASICASIDDVVVHGIPNNRQLREGEIISIDVGVKKNNFFGDGAWTFPVDEVSIEKQRLMQVAEESLYKGIEQSQVGRRVSDISAAIQTHVEKAGFSVVRDLVGHGIGRELHEEPAVPNFGSPGTGMVLKEGMTLAIEPMVNAGTYRVNVGADGWTVHTADGLPSAHFEHTVLITQNGPEILTL